MSALAQNQQDDIDGFKILQSREVAPDLISSLQIAINYAEFDDYENDPAPKKTNEKRKIKTYYEYCSSGIDSDGASYKASKACVRDKNDLHLSQSGLPLYLNVTDVDRIAVSSIADWVKQSELAS